MGFVNRRFSPEGHERQIGLYDDLLWVSGDSWGFADKWSKLKANKDIFFKHRIKNSVFFYFAFKL